MTDILQVVGGTMLIGIPISLILSFVCASDLELEIKPLALWAVCYLLYVLLAATVFAGVAGAAMLIGAFR